MEKRERLLDFGLEKESWCGENLDHQNDRFLYQLILYDKGVIIRYSFTLKIPKKIYLSSGRFLVSGFELVFFFYFEAMDWFDKFPIVFLGQK